MNRISAKGTAFCDELGRERIFNGINFVYKGCEPDEDGIIRYRPALTDEELEALAKRGMNIIRLGLTWAAVEPTPGHYNTVYLDGMKEIVKRCEKHGFYVFLDWHQDLFSHFCYLDGDGAPEWACEIKGEAKKAPIIWATGYFFGKRTHRSYDAFWKNEDFEGRGLQDRFCDMLAYTAEYFKDEPAVMGYDVLNEPFPGTPGGKVFRKLVLNGVGTLLFSDRIDRKKLISDIRSMRIMDALAVADDRKVYNSIIHPANRLIEKFDLERYYPFLRNAAAAIRRVDPDRIIFAENCYYSNLGIPCSVPVLKKENGENDPNFAFAPHGYDLTVDTPLTNEASPYRVDHIFDEHVKTQQRMQVPVLVGEWGGMVPGGERYPALEHLVDRFDRSGWSQTYWHYHSGMANGKIMDILSRPYPMAVAGTIRSYGYDRVSRTFTLTYTGSSVVKAPTLIYLPEEPKKIFSTKTYVIKEVEGTKILSVYAGKGDCVVKVEF